MLHYKKIKVMKEQKLIDLMFEMVMAATNDPVFCKKPRGERVDWVANNLREMGFDTHPIGMSWGKLVGEDFRKTIKPITDNLDN
jgi:hypothetical protein